MDTILNESWFSLTLAQQMVNIGNEVKRALRFDSSPSKRKFFLDKAISYTNLTMKDPKNSHVIPELLISKEVLEDYGNSHYLNCSKEQIEQYYAVYQLFL